MPVKHPIRSMYVAPKDHYLVQADFSQAEAWIVAFRSGDEKMKHFLQFGDIHSETGYLLDNPPSSCDHRWDDHPKGKQCSKCQAIVEKEKRTVGKRVNHGSNYRMSHFRQAEIINAEGPPYVTNEDTKRWQQVWRNTYTGVPKWWAEIEWLLEHNNRTLRTTYGRECTFMQPWGDDLFKEATAWEPQSTVGDHANGVTHPELGIEGGFVTVHNRLGNGKPAWIVNASHDSILLEVPKPLLLEISQQVRDILQRPLVIAGEMFTIPVDVEYGERYGELEKVKLP